MLVETVPRLVKPAGNKGSGCPQGSPGQTPNRAGSDWLAGTASLRAIATDHLQMPRGRRKGLAANWRVKLSRLGRHVVGLHATVLRAVFRGGSMKRSRVAGLSARRSCSKEADMGEAAQTSLPVQKNAHARQLYEFWAGVVGTCPRA